MSSPGHVVGQAPPEPAAADRLDAVALAERFGTPLYVYDFDQVSARVAALRAVLPPTFDLAYAVKANPAVAIVAHLASLGVGGDVASRGELETVMRAGMPAERIVFTGPGKSDRELRRASELGIRAVTVESLGELDRLERFAADAGHVVGVLLRANLASAMAACDDAAEGHTETAETAETAAETPAAGSERVRIIGDGGAGKFGMSPADLGLGAAHAVRSRHLSLLGLHAFGASNLLDAATFIEHVRLTMELAVNLARAVQAPLRLVDVGGGLGIPYAADETALDLDAIRSGLARLSEAWAGNPVSRDAMVLVEPGRYLVGPAGTYFARVVSRKRIGRTEVAVLDGGMNHVLRPALVGQPHRVEVLDREARPRAADPAGPPVSIVGPLCTGLDTFAVGAALAVPDRGDLVAIRDVGAYGFTESMPLFLSHATPAEVAIRGGRVALIRPSMEPETWLDLQRLPAW